MNSFFELVNFKNLFLYDPSKPLLFTQFYFWGFFFLVLCFYCIVYKKKAIRNTYLFLVSLFFYYKTGGVFVILLIFTILSAFFITKWMHKVNSVVKKKLLLALCVIVNLLILFYFKYAEFIVSSVNQVLQTHFNVVNYFSLLTNKIAGTNFVTDKIILPVGISFFTFQAISYAVDVFNKKIEPVKSVLDFGFYVSFFPQLVAGPIVRASEFIPQLYSDFNLTKKEFGLALFMILKGLIKKVFISDYISINFIDRVFSNPNSYSGFETLMSLYGYSMQVYADFSGYTDIAIGLALLMGFRLSINFNSPYKAKSTAEFWHRWHISLSTWLKDYLYIPIGGNRNGSIGGFACWFVILAVLSLLSGSLYVTIGLASLMVIFFVVGYYFPDIKATMITQMNNLITMLLGGLWHGSSWMFVIWGGYNGIGLVIYKLWKGEKQILRWIIFGAFNLTALLTYKFGLWQNANLLILWALIDIFWLFAYFVWLFKYKENNYQVLRNILSGILLCAICLVFTVCFGFWQGENKYLIWALISSFTIGVFYMAKSIEFKKTNIKVTASLWTGLVVFLSLLYFGYSNLFVKISLIAFIILLSAYLYMIVRPQTKDPNKFVVYFWGIFLTFNFITFTRIWFRAPDIPTSNLILERLLNGWTDISLIPEMIMGYKNVFAVMLFGFVIHWLSANYKEKYTNFFIELPTWAKVLICIFTIFVLFQVKASDLQPFIYFQF